MVNIMVNIIIIKNIKNEKFKVLKFKEIYDIIINVNYYSKAYYKKI